MAKIDVEVKEVVGAVKTFTPNIIDVYDDSVVIMVNDWRMGVYLDLPVEELEYYQEHKEAFKGRKINVEYVGDLNDVNTLSYLPIKTLVK